ncbi:MAG: hypothetical protein BWZ10_03516 [candidate division BRC1 bacterium ADurb.BinA364]|nr:MAG: hypothetical protein BWZ10_03516 [candidate division BRC1 bacterium ADurb.BinA364]
MFGRIRIPAGERIRLLAPEQAIERIGQLAFVNVVEPDGAVSRRLATFGARTGDGRIEALSGLRAGETLLLRKAAQ